MEAPAGNQQKTISQLIYSLVLIVFIPAMMVFNIYWTWTSVRNNTDVELRRKAILANQIISSAITKSGISNPDELQKQLQKIKKESTEFEEASILVPKGNDFSIIASTNTDKINTIAEGYESTIAWKEGEPTAIIASFKNNGNSEITRIWSVTNPVFDGKEKIALIDSKVSLADIDELTATTLRQTLIILISTVALTLLLLINHFRLFESAVLVKRLQDIDQMKDDFINIASHELKTPVAIIRGYISNAVQIHGKGLSEKVKKDLETVSSQAARLNDLVNDLLNVSRLEQGRLAFDLQPQKLDGVVREIISNLQVKAKEKSLELKYTEFPSLPTILADTARLREIFTNIIGNAVKYTLKGAVEVYHEVDGNMLRTIVKDSGIGMSAEEREHLFEKFYRVKNDATASIPGTGLGLWITKSMIEKMKGKIFVDSMHNVGTQFTIVFPITDQAVEGKKKNN